MLKDGYGTSFSRVLIRVGYTDLRKGIDGLADIVRQQFGMDPMEPGTLFLFCGRRCDRIKGLICEDDGNFLLLYKRLEAGSFTWPRTENQARELSRDQFLWLMQGLSIDQKKAIPKYEPKRIA